MEKRILIKADSSLSDHLILNSDKIISTLQFLFPHETTAEELDLLINADIEIVQASKVIVDGYYPMNLYLKTSNQNYRMILKHIPEIERHVLKKAGIVSKWITECRISEVRVIASSK